MATGTALAPITYTPTAVYDYKNQPIPLGFYKPKHWRLVTDTKSVLLNPDAASFQLTLSPWGGMSSNTTLVNISRQSTAIKSSLSYETTVTGLQPKINLISSPSSYNQCEPITLFDPALITNSSNRQESAPLQ